MAYKDFKNYKPTLWDKIKIEGGGTSFLILFLAGIWYEEFRWRLIFTALFILGMTLLNVAVLLDREKDAKKNAENTKEVTKQC